MFEPRIPVCVTWSGHRTVGSCGGSTGPGAQGALPLEHVIVLIPQVSCHVTSQERSLITLNVL